MTVVGLPPIIVVFVDVAVSCGWDGWIGVADALGTPA